MKKCTILFVLLLAIILFVGFADANFFPPPPSLAHIYIRGDGSLEPADLPIDREGNEYKLTANLLNVTLEIQRSSVTINGNGYIMDGYSIGNGITMANQTNIIVKNVTLRNFRVAAQIDSSSNCKFIDVTATTSEVGIYLFNSSGNEISFCNVTGNFGDGIVLYDGSSHNIIADNLISQNRNGAITFAAPNSAWNQSTCNYNSILRNDIPANSAYGLIIWGSSNCRIEMNNISRSKTGIQLDGATCQNNIIRSNLLIGNPEHGILLTGLASHNTVTGNNIAWNGVGVENANTENNQFHSNNFITNVRHVANNYEDIAPIPTNRTTLSVNGWYDNVSMRGNYWTGFFGRDDNSDGLGDMPYVLDANNSDSYPLMKLYGLVPDYLIPPPTPTAPLTASNSPSPSPTVTASPTVDVQVPAVPFELAFATAAVITVLAIAAVFATRKRMTRNIPN